MLSYVSTVGRGVMVAGALATLWAVPARAQFTSGVNSDKKFAITAEAGGFFSSDLYTYSGAANSLNFSDAFTYGGRLAYIPRPNVAIEVGYMYANMDITTDVQINGTNDVGSVGLNQIDIDGLFGGGNGKAWGYFAVGLGMTITNPSVSDALKQANVQDPSSETLFSWNLGGGVVLIPKGKVGFRIDGRFRSTDTNHTTNTGGYCSIYGYCYTYATSWYSSGELTGGITVRF
jgi:hypothetical protein